MYTKLSRFAWKSFDLSGKLDWVAFSCVKTEKNNIIKVSGQKNPNFCYSCVNSRTVEFLVAGVELSISSLSSLCLIFTPNFSEFVRNE